MNRMNSQAASGFLAPCGMYQARPPVKLAKPSPLPRGRIGRTAKFSCGATRATMPSIQFSYIVIATRPRANCSSPWNVVEKAS